MILLGMKGLNRVVSFVISREFVTCQKNDDDKEEAPVEVRLAAAKKLLSESSQISLVYVKGLVCPSCAIGIRKNLSKMEGVDKKRFRDGIDMNPETQLVTIALKKGEAAPQRQLH